MFTFNFDIDFSVAFYLLVAAVLCALLAAWFLLRPACRIIRARRLATARNDEPNNDGIIFPEALPDVSVVLYVGEEEAPNFERALAAVLGQRYDGRFEVVVVNDGRSEQAEQAVRRMRAIHDNLYMTYCPDDARGLSRKKLALMIGIKAAHNPIVVLTTGAAMIGSDNWLTEMARPFVSDHGRTEIVIGQSRVLESENPVRGSRRRAFDASADATNWLGAALARRPYRGTEMNLAYTRDAFFRNGGFKNTLNLTYGDDDIFVSEIARGDNTQVVMHPDAVVARATDDVPRTVRELDARYHFTARRIAGASRLGQWFGIILVWAVIGLAVAGSLLMLPNLFGAAVSLLLLIALFAGIIIVWSKTTEILSDRKLSLSVPGLLLTRPFRNMTTAARSRRYAKYYQTWK